MTSGISDAINITGRAATNKVYRSDFAVWWYAGDEGGEGVTSITLLPGAGMFDQNSKFILVGS